MRKLASIQKIEKISPIKNADNIECAFVLGWRVVVKKGEFKRNDLCIYCEIDSILPPKPEFEFLASSKYRVRTVKLRGQISQGICFPLNILPHDTSVYKLGDDITELLGVKKYEPPLSGNKTGLTKGSFPASVPKTDEIRIQSVPELLNELKGTVCVSTVKVDGTSASFIKCRGEIDICSRTRSVKQFVTARQPDGKEKQIENVYWQMYHKYNIDKIFENLDNLAIQGEIAGFWFENQSPIQSNRLKLQDTQLFVFNVFDIEAQRYFNFEEMTSFCKQWGLQQVPVDDPCFVLNTTIPELLEKAEGSYPNGGPREGIVIRPLVEKYSNVLLGRASFKVINNKYLLKHKG